MTNAEDIHRFLEERFGGPGNLIIKDGGSETGFRTWEDGDTNALLAWLDSNQCEENGESIPSICHNIDQTAELVGVSTPVVQSWLRRSQNPLPHMQHGRRIIVPRFALIKWMREECERTITRE